MENQSNLQVWTDWDYTVRNRGLYPKVKITKQLSPPENGVKDGGKGTFLLLNTNTNNLHSLNGLSTTLAYGVTSVSKKIETDEETVKGIKCMSCFLELSTFSKM